MIQIALVVSACLAPLFSPIALSMALSVGAAAVLPLSSLAVGVLIDALYWSPGAYAYPFYTFVGGAITLVAYGARRFIETSIM